LTVADRRAEGPFTGVFYNEVVSGKEDEGLKRPVWGAEVNSIIVKPGSKAVVEAKEEGMKIEGWAWSEYGVAEVEVSVDEGETWVRANVKERKEYEWQGFDAEVNVKEGSQRAMSRARCKSGAAQPMHGRRNHVHKVEFAVV
jgi:hypothetical protein